MLLFQAPSILDAWQVHIKPLFFHAHFVLIILWPFIRTVIGCIFLSNGHLQTQHSHRDVQKPYSNAAKPDQLTGATHINATV